MISHSYLIMSHHEPSAGEKGMMDDGHRTATVAFECRLFLMDVKAPVVTKTVLAHARGVQGPSVKYSPSVGFCG